MKRFLIEMMAMMLIKIAIFVLSLFGEEQPK